MRRVILLLIVLGTCEAAWAQARLAPGARQGVGRTVIVAPFYPSYAVPAYRGTSARGSLAVNAYPRPYTVGRGEWLPDGEMPQLAPSSPGPAWNWSRVDVPALAAMVRQNQGR
jgi:hypothetical protein